MYKLSFLIYLLRKISFDYLPFRNKKNSLLIVIYHQVNDKKNTYYPSVPTPVFYKTCLFLKKYYSIIHVNEIEDYIKSKKKKPAAIITFDDGLRDIKDNVFDFVTKNNIKISINIDTEILETKKPQYFMRIYDILNTTNFEGEYFDNEFMLEPIHVSKSNPNQVEVEFTKILSSLSTIEKRTFIDRLALHVRMNDENYTKVLSVEDLEFFSKNPLIEFGSHSHSHPILTNIPQVDLELELKTSKLNLEKITGSPVTILAYPNGISNENVKTTALNLGYKFLLHSNNTINKIQNNTIDFDRINQYHTNFELGIANMFGILSRIKKIVAK